MSMETELEKRLASRRQAEQSVPSLRTFEVTLYNEHATSEQDVLTTVTVEAHTVQFAEGILMFHTITWDEKLGSLVSYVTSAYAKDTWFKVHEAQAFRSETFPRTAH